MDTATPAVGQDRISRAHACLSDAELESHVLACGKLMLAAYARYEESSDFQDRADADRWRMVQEEAIRARSPAQVARMEAALELGGAVA